MVAHAALVAALSIGLYLPKPLYASTPQQAAINMIYEPLAAPAVAVRTNAQGQFAVVHVKAREKRGGPIDGPILVQRFSFGWEALDFVEGACALSIHGIPKETIAMLLAGMPARTGECARRQSDSGPVADIETIRKIQPFGYVPSVTVIGDYAKADWYGPGGGERIYRRTDGTWKIILGGGGAHSAQDLRRAGVPRSAICKFHIYDATGC